MCTYMKGVATLVFTLAATRLRERRARIKTVPINRMRFGVLTENLMEYHKWSSEELFLSVKRLAPVIVSHFRCAGSFSYSHQKQMVKLDEVSPRQSSYH